MSLTMRTIALPLLALGMSACGGGSAPATPTPAAPADPAVAALDTQAARFAPTELSADIAGLPEPERQALAHMIRAAQVMDALFLRQVWAGNESMLYGPAAGPEPDRPGPLGLLPDQQGAVVAARSQHGVRARRAREAAGGQLLRRRRVAGRGGAVAGSLPAPARTAATGFFTTIRRGATGGFIAVPYSVEYQGELALAADHLRAAADLTTQPTLKAFLEARAAAFLSNDYYDSDVKWMELDATVEPTIGPYEVYEDEWFNAKAAFEAFITVKDAAESAKLTRFADALQSIEDALPIDPKYRNPTLGALAPIAVVNTVFSAGDGNRGVQTAAFNLPNDERVVREKGTKRVMLKNNQQAKFDKVLVPIAQVALAPADRGERRVRRLLHPHPDARAGPRPRSARHHGGRAGDHGAPGAEGDLQRDRRGEGRHRRPVRPAVPGRQGAIAKDFERTMYTTFLASAFRSIRFGITEAHGRGQAVQLNYLLDKGAFTVNADGTFAVAAGTIREAVTALTHDLMTLQAEGNYAAAKVMLDTLGVIRPPTQAVLDRLKDVPVDIAPRFPTAEALLAKYLTPNAMRFRAARRS